MLSMYLVGAVALLCVGLSTSDVFGVNSNFDVSLIGFEPPTFTNESAYSFGKISINGNGCPANSVDVITSTNGKAVSVLFSKYIAETTPKKSRVRLACNVAIPVDIKAGVSVAVIAVDYRGYVYVPEGPGQKSSYADFKTEYFWSGTRGLQFRNKYRMGFDDEIFVQQQVPVGKIIWSECGGKSELFRISTSITAKRASRDPEAEQVSIQMDSTDGVIKDEKMFRYHVIARKC